MLKTIRRKFVTDLTFTSAVATADAVFTSCSEDRFAVFNAESLKKTVFAVDGSSRCVALDNVRSQPDVFMSCDFDGTVKMWDLRQQNRLAATSRAGRDFLPKGAFFGTAAISPDGRCICAGTCGLKAQKPPRTSKKTRRKKHEGPPEAKRPHLATEATTTDSSDDGYPDVLSAFLVCWDTRRLSGEPICMLNDLHTDDINCVTFDPNNASRVLSCADDGLVCLCDLEATDEDSRLLEVFNVEHQANLCGFLDPCGGQSSESVFVFDSMQTRFSAFSALNPASHGDGDDAPEEPSPVWRKLRTPKSAKHLLAARLLPPSQSTNGPPTVCLLSSWAMKNDIRLSVVTPETAVMVAKRPLLKRSQKSDLDCEAVYANFLSIGPREADVIVVGRHSVNRLRAGF